MDTLFGIPAHPLVVHAPVVLLPLAFVGVVLMMVRATWFEHFKWPVFGITLIGAIGAIFATGSGEALEEQIEETEGREALRSIHGHAEAGEGARTFAILFLIALALWIFVPIFLARRRAAAAAAGSTPEAEAATSAPASYGGPRWLRPVLMVFVALTAIASMVTIIDAGHSGAESVWKEETNEHPQGGGGEVEEDGD